MIPTKNKSGHIGWMDYAKAIAIYSVVLLHTHCVESLSVAINAFVMPSFFFLSGFLFSSSRNPEFKPFALKRFRQLVVPYLWINVIAYLLWFFALRHYGTNPADAIEWHKPLIAIALGLPPALTHDIPLWSLLCFFIVEMIYYIVGVRWGISDWIIAAIGYAVAAIISICAGSEGLALPLTLTPAMAALAFYSIGHIARKYSSRLKRMFSPSPVILLSGIALLGLAFELNRPTAFFIGVLGNPVWFFIGATGGIIMVVQTASWLERIFHDGKTVRIISRGTLLICGFHLLAFAFIKAIMLFGFGISPELLTDGFVRGVIMATVATALCIPIILVIERYFRFLVYK